MFEWEDYLALAERLAADTDDEAVQRTAISRAYYAAYHAAAVFVRDNGLLLTRHSHRTVWAALTRDPDADRARVGRQGDRLKRVREEADYQRPFAGDFRVLVPRALAEARSLIDAFQRLS